MAARMTTYIITMTITRLFIMGGTFCPHFIQCNLQLIELYMVNATISIFVLQRFNKIMVLGSLLEILSFATIHYATGMQLIVVCNYLGHICNYKFGIV
jgi:hypothetical protein